MLLIRLLLADFRRLPYRDLLRSIRFHLGGLNRLAGVVAPAVARVGDHRRDVDVGERALPGDHRRRLAVLDDSVQDRLDLVVLGARNDLRAVERRKCAGDALAGRLMTGSAIRRVDLLAVRDQLLRIPDLVRIGARSRRGLLVFGDPLRVIIGALDLDHDGHEAVLLAADLRALAAENARLVEFKPVVADEARNGILLYAGCRQEPGMNDVTRGNEQANLLAYRQDQRLVDFEQIVLGQRLPAFELGDGCAEIAVEIEALGEIVVIPLPLRAGDLDGQVGHGSVLHLQNGPGRWNRHDQQDEERNHGPDDF